jgi:adenylate cyclase
MARFDRMVWMRNKVIKKAIGFVSVLLISAFFFGAWEKIELGGLLSLTWQDFLYSTRIKTKEEIKDVVIVVADEPSFKELGQQWPWSRQRHATVVENLARAGARAIIFDILFPEPSLDPRDDEIFAAAIKKAGNVSLGKFNSFTQRENYIQSIVVEPVPILKEAAAVTGLVNHFPDQDGIVRYAYKYLDSSPSLAYSGCLAASLEGMGCTENTFLIDFKQELTAVPIISYYQVLENLVDPDTFTDKFVFIGLGSEVKVDAQGAVDAFPTPFFRFKKKMMYGVEIHANALMTLLSGCGLKMFDTPLMLLIFFSLSITPFWVRKKPMLLTTVGGGGIVGLGAFSMILFNIQGLVIDIMPAVLATAANTLFLGLNEFRRSHKERRYIKHAFESYVSSDIVKTILDNPATLTLGGERKELTVMFADINGFTTVSETLEPEELVSVLNDYLQLITQVVLEHKGTLDKYIGDAVMAFFGAPVHFENHAYKACAASLFLDSHLNRREKTAAAVFSGITMGINTGHMIVGNIGSQKRFDYTVIGDTVNLAARLEGLNKTYGTALIIGENTKKHLTKDAFLTRELDYVKVKGKQKAISIHEVLENTRKNREDLVMPFAEGLAAYRRQDWIRGEAIFSAILKQFPADGPSNVFLERCRYFMQNPLPKGWNMIWEMLEK